MLMAVVAEADVRQAIAVGRRRLAVPADAVLTPQAIDLAERHALRIVRGDQPAPAPAGIDPARATSRVLLRRSPRWIAPPPRRGVTPIRFGRIAFVGSGSVGATAAHLTAVSGMTDQITLIDLVPGLAAGTALDIEHASGSTGSPTRARGGTSLHLVAGADAVVVTAGRPRTPGLTRAALGDVNGRVIRDVAEAIAAHAPDAVVIVVTNPVDEMTYEMWRATGLPPEQVIGMAGTLDSSRFRDALATAANARPADVWAVTLGSHGAEMVPVVSTATIRGRPARSVLSAQAIAECVQTAVDGGAAVIALRRTGSAFIAPAHAVVELLDAMRGATADPKPVSAMVRGEYGIDGIYLGVRAVLGPGGVVTIIEDPLEEAEMSALRAAAEAIRARLRT
jgi:malate dehydrogenase